MNERQSSEVKVYSVERFESKVHELNRKAAKAGAKPVTYQIGSEWVKEKVWVRFEGEDVEQVFFYKVAVIEWDEIVYPGGWRLAGVIDHQEGLVKSVPGFEIGLQQYKERGAVCDHCHTERDRKETFIVVDGDGTVKQVGRSCIHLFLGVSVERALSGVGLSIGAGGLDEDQRGVRQPTGYGIETFLASAATVIRLNGWRSRSNAGQEGRATADLAWENIENAAHQAKDKHGLPLWVESSVEDVETAKKVVVWLAELGQRRGLNDYQSNLAQIGQNDFVSFKSSGYAASAIVAWGKELEQEIKRAAERQSEGRTNEYFGKVGERLRGLELTLTKSFGFENEWGVSFIHRFLDSQGRLFVWKTATELDLGEYTVTATVKAQDEYKGERQTVLTRASLEKRQPVAVS